MTDLSPDYILQHSLRILPGLSEDQAQNYLLNVRDAVQKNKFKHKNKSIVIQGLVFEADGLEDFSHMLRSAIDVCFKPNGQYTQLKIIEPNKCHITNDISSMEFKILPICVLEDYRSDKTEGLICRSHTHMHNEIMKKLRNFDTDRIEGEIEFDDPYWDDGVGVAYRVHYEPNAGWNRLIVSVTYALYGK